MRAHSFLAFLLGAFTMASTAQVTPDQAPGHVTGIGGVFIKGKYPKALAAWYRDVLGMPVQPWGGAALRDDAPGHSPKTAWSVFDASSDHFAPSTSAFMINYAVDDMDAMVKRLQDQGRDGAQAYRRRGIRPLRLDCRSGGQQGGTVGA